MTKSDKKKKANPYVRFSAMAVQMGVIIGAGAWGGSLLDEKFQSEKPIWTIVLALLGVGASLYLFIKEAQKLSKDD